MIFLFFLFFTEEKVNGQCWVNSESNKIIYCIFGILIIINFGFIFGVFSDLIDLKKKYEEFEKDL
jgi:hypothetical protein